MATTNNCILKNTRVLKEDKGLILALEYIGDLDPKNVEYKTSKGEYKHLPSVVLAENKQETETPFEIGTYFYCHVDDTTNEVLVLNKESFRY
jgi:hypothetical protein